MLERKGLIKFSVPAEEDIHYNWSQFMHSVITFAVRLLEGLFGIGMAGTVLVLLSTGFEDLRTILDGLTRSGKLTLPFREA